MISKRDMQKAVDLHRKGRYDEALALYEELQEVEPGNAHLFHFRGLIKSHTGDFRAARSLFLEAVRLDPGQPLFLEHLAETLEKLNERARAGVVYGDLGNLLLRQASHEAAVAAYDKSLKIDPSNQSIKSKRLFALQHLAAKGRNLRETSLLVIKDLAGRAKTAVDFLRLAIAYQAVLEHRKGLAAVDRAIQLQPDYAAAHMVKAGLLLIEGRWAEGWLEDEWRWHPQSNLADKVRGNFPAPMWTGRASEGLAGTLLVVSEQGYGDTLQFCRYVKLLADMGVTVLFEVQRPLLSLMRHSLRHPNIRIIPRIAYRWDKWDLGWLGRILGQKAEVAGSLDLYHGLRFSAWAGLMSLPSRFGTTPETVPAAVPYLSVSARHARRWSRIMRSLGGSDDSARVKVGLVWAGNAGHAEDFNRSLTLEQLAPILALEHVRFYSLQKDGTKALLASGANVIDLSPRLKVFNDTAAAIETLDLVITVDTSVAHLAGGLGKPVWIVIPRVKDWRWGQEGSTTPWYPSARLFRQHEQGNWSQALKELASALETYGA